ncbi:uncharacterized protein LOC119167977 isoform X1 [Rhipicephalus microplus]|uniref:Putative lipocalin lipocalin n=1 Tax=Rhipicephalus microplus TaxID=6941 RepID=A0A6G5A5I7_RHIMP
MVQTLAFKLIIYVCSLGALDGACWSCLKRSYSIREFFFTREPIWTHTTSAKTRISCLVDVVNVMETRSVIFTRSCYSNGYKVSRAFEGIFDKFRRKHMNVTPKGNGANFQEDILYMSSDRSCAVIAVTYPFCGRHVMYDLRVRNSHIQKPLHHKCVHVYQKYERYGRVLYNSSCQGILPSTIKAGLYQPNDRCPMRMK